MNPPPRDWPRIASAVYYKDAVAAIDWLCKAFGFEVRLKIEADGHIHHSELVFGGGMIMVGEEGLGAEKDRPWRKSPGTVGGGNTQNMMVFVDDADAHCARARAAGAKITDEPRDHDYGAEYWTDRGYECVDPEGHHWWFFQRLRDQP